MNRPEHGAVDLDFVDDPDASDDDRALDARLAGLVSDRVLALEPPPSRVDVAAAKRAAADARPRRGRRAVQVAAGLAASAVVVAAAGVGSGLVTVPGPAGWGASSGGPDTGAVRLRSGVPALPAEETARLKALQDPSGLRAGRFAPASIGSWVTPVDCDGVAARLGVEPAVLDGLDATGLREVCATREVTGDGRGQDVSVYRFYLPQGVELDDVREGDATDAGVSWTEVLVDDAPQTTTAQDLPANPGGGLTTVTWDDGLAAVHRAGPRRTEVSWVEPYGRSDAQGTYPTLVRAVVAAAPVTAVRAAVGFVNQGGTQVLRGDDGSLLLVPTSPPQAWFQALTSGALTRSPEGCLGLDQGEYGFQLVLWPFGTTWDAAAQVLTVPGDGEHRLGEDLRLGGGGFDDGGPASDLVPAGCATNGIWLASGESLASASDAP